MITLRPIVRMRFALAAALLVCAGCVSSRSSDRLPPEVRERLSHIEATSLVELSRSRPVPLDKAAAQEMTQPSDPTTRPATSRTPGAAAIDAVELTLPEVRAAALANNLDLQVELINPRTAQQVVNEEEAKFESLLLGSAGYRRDARAGGADAQQYDLGLLVPLRTGGSAIVSVPFSRSTEEPRYEAGLQFSVSHPLLRNAGVRVNMHSIRVARFGKGVVDARTKLEAIRILANADRVYWLLYAARAELRVRQQQYELAMRQVDEARKRAAAQAAARIEITRAQSGLAARLEAIIVSETNVRRRERELKRIIRRPDLPPASATPVIPVTEPNPLKLDLSPELLAARAVANRMEMLELELQLAIDASTIDFARNQTLPLFVLDYTYNVVGSGRGAGPAFDSAADLDDQDWSIQLRGEVPIGNAAARARLHRAILQRVQRLATREQRRLAIEQEVYDAVDQLAQDWQRILAARNEAILAARTYQAERRQFELAIRTSTDVLDAAARLASAQSREIQALADYQLSLIDIAFATGTLFGHGRISLMPLSEKALVERVHIPK
jgi:outer membrane protein TolC